MILPVIALSQAPGGQISRKSNSHARKTKGKVVLKTSKAKEAAFVKNFIFEQNEFNYTFRDDGWGNSIYPKITVLYVNTGLKDLYFECPGSKIVKVINLVEQSNIYVTQGTKELKILTHDKQVVCTVLFDIPIKSGCAYLLNIYKKGMYSRK